MEPIKIKVDRRELQQALRVTGFGRATRSANPMYNNYRMEITKKGTICLDTCDGVFVAVQKEISCEVEKMEEESFVSYLYGNTLKKLLELIPEDEVELAVYHSQIKVSSGKKSYMMPLSDYIDELVWKKEEGDSVYFSAEVPDMKKWLECLGFCMADDEFRPAMNAMLIDLKGNEMTMVSTDGRILCRMNVTNVDVNCTRQFILPKKTAKVLQRVLPKTGFVDFVIREKSADIIILDADANITKLVTKTIEGKYPNYLAVIREDYPYNVKMDRKELMNCIRRLGLVANQNSALTKWELTKESVKIGACDNDFAMSGEEELPMEVDKLPGENEFKVENGKMLVGMNYRMLIGILQHIKSTKVLMQFRTQNNGLIFREDGEQTGDNILYMMMPMRVDE